MWFYLEEKEIIVETCHSFTDHKLSQFKNINDRHWHLYSINLLLFQKYLINKDLQIQLYIKKISLKWFWPKTLTSSPMFTSLAKIKLFWKVFASSHKLILLQTCKITTFLSLDKFKSYFLCLSLLVKVKI